MLPFSVRMNLVLSYVAWDATSDKQRCNSKCLENLKEKRNQQVLEHWHLNFSWVRVLNEHLTMNMLAPKLTKSHFRHLSPLLIWSFLQHLSRLWCYLFLLFSYSAGKFCHICHMFQMNLFMLIKWKIMLCSYMIKKLLIYFVVCLFLQLAYKSFVWRQHFRIHIKVSVLRNVKGNASFQD